MTSLQKVYTEAYERGLNKGKIIVADVLLNFILENREKITIEFLIDALRDMKGE